MNQKNKPSKDVFQESMIFCINDMHILIKALDNQSLALQNYDLDHFQELENNKIKALKKYEISIQNFLKAPNPHDQVQKNLKDLFLKSYEKLKQSLLTNQMILEASQEVQRNVIAIYKKYIEGQLQNKSYGHKGSINKPLPVMTFRTNM